MQKIVLFLLLIAISCKTAVAQNSCSCSGYTALKNTGISDSAIAKKLQVSSYAICKAKGYELMASWLLASNNTDSVEFLLQAAEAAYRKTSCGDSSLLFTYKYWGQWLHAKGEFAKAQEKFLKMLAAAEAAGNVYETAVSYTMIAQMFNQTNQADKGIMLSLIHI